MRNGRTRRLRWGAVALAAASLVLSGCSAGSLGSSSGGGSGDGGVTLTLLVYGDTTIAQSEQAAKDFSAANPGITVKVESRPQGADGDNVVKTRLSTGDMADLFEYNAGSLLQTLSPQQQLTPLTGESWVGDLDEDFRTGVTVDNEVYGAPFGSSFGGGVLYSKPVYERLGLQVPTTWAEFMANNATIKAAGIDPVVQTYKSTWTSQLFVLADFHNVAAAEPGFAQDYTAGKTKFSTSPAAIKGFEHLEAVHTAGYQNADFASATQEDGLRKVAAGEAAHYPMLTAVVTAMVQDNPDAAQTVGFFALPGDDAATNGATSWLSTALYVPSTVTGAKLDAAKKFLAFIASPQGCDAFTTVAAPTGPYMVQGCALPADVPQSVKDFTAYVERGAASPALEYLSPVKGPALEQITVEVGSGIRSAQDGAALYDEDVKKQAQQLGLPGWE